MKDMGEIIILVVIAVLLCCLAPMLMIWSVNTLAESGGSSFYIEHNFWSYLASFVLVLVFNGGSASK